MAAACSTTSFESFVDVVELDSSAWEDQSSNLDDTTESQWLLVDADEPEILDDGEKNHDISPTWVPDVPNDVVNGNIVAAAPLCLGSACLAECEGFRGDVTAEWGQAFSETPSVFSAFRLGRVLVVPGKMHREQSFRLPVITRVVVQNTSSSPWPDATTLRLVAGQAHGFEIMQLGCVFPGHAADITMDLNICVDSSNTPGLGCRSAWVLVDDLGRPFGPLLVLEVMWL